MPHPPLDDTTEPKPLFRVAADVTSSVCLMSLYKTLGRPPLFSEYKMLADKVTDEARDYIITQITWSGTLHRDMPDNVAQAFAFKVAEICSRILSNAFPDAPSPPTLDP